MVSFAKRLAIGLPLVAATLLSTIPARAQDTEADKGWYLSVGRTLYNSRKRSEDIGLGTAAEFKDGWMYSGALGYRFTPRAGAGTFRIEGEYGIQNNRNKNFVVLASGTKFQSRGNVQLESMMANIYYDFAIRSIPKLTPYVGFGIGQYQSKINGFTTAVSSPLSDSGVVLSTTSPWTDTKQWKVGVNYAIDRQTTVFAGYRYFDGDTLSFTFAVPPGTTLNPGTSWAVVPLDVTGGKSHNFEVGFRINL